MMHVYKNIELHSEKFQRFVNVLSQLGWNNICLFLKEKLEDELSHSEAVSDVLILEKHVPILTDILAEYCYKWNCIGTALYLPMSVLKKLEDKEVTQGPHICLRDVFYEWITGSYENSRPATLHSLKLALKSHLVGLGRVILTLENGLSELKYRFFSETFMRCKFAIEYQSGNTKVRDGNSALLEVQVSSNESVVYQWMKDGEILSDDLTYSGVNTPVLFIACVSQRLHGGKFCCQVRNSNETIQSNEVVLLVVYSPEKKHLLNLYSCKGEVPKDAWPPVRTNKFFKLILYKKGEVNDAYDYYPYRNLEKDIVSNKEELKYENMFYLIDDMILIEGRPGCGKTTLAHKITMDWAIRKKYIGKYGQSLLHFTENSRHWC